MRAQAGAVGRGIRLDGVALVQEPLVVDILQQVPEGLDVAVVVGDVRVVHVHPVADALGHDLPFLRIFHHLLAAGGVVLAHGNLRADVGLGDAELLLHTQFHREAVGIPTGTAVHLESSLGLVAADGILDGPRHHMMDAGHAVGGRRSLEEDEFRTALPDFQRLLEGVVREPSLEDRVPRRYQIKTLVFFECHIFCLILQCKDKHFQGQWQHSTSSCSAASSPA